MKWFLENWFSIVVMVAFVAMHLVGHGGHGRHGGHGCNPAQRNEPQNKDEGAGRRDETGSGRHQH